MTLFKSNCISDRSYAWFFYARDNVTNFTGRETVYRLFIWRKYAYFVRRKSRFGNFESQGISYLYLSVNNANIDRDTAMIRILKIKNDGSKILFRQLRFRRGHAFYDFCEQIRHSLPRL